MIPRRLRWDIFCRVVDNYGDIGVCRRLARTLAAEHGQSVRVWIDRIETLAAWFPGIDPAAAALRAEGVEYCRWEAPFREVPDEDIADVVVEAFACELPEAYVAAMARRPRAPAWINLEYLSAEAWVEGCHARPSPHPRLPLVKHFWFPGFTAATGGLLREAGLIEARDAYRRGAPREALAAALKLEPVPEDALLVSLFAYEQPGLAGLLRCWAEAACPVVVVVPEGRVLADVASHFGLPARAGARLCAGALRVEVVPFVDQAAYDRELWACDLNFVRGEDSFVRAQWAARPFVWHIYRQEDEAHRIKLDAFLDAYTAALDAPSANALRRFWHAWNGAGDLGLAWPDFAAALPALGRHAEHWSRALGGRDDLATLLVDFCRKLL